MTQQNPLDITGSLQSNPLAEILIEIGTAGFNGSLRLSNNDQKTVVYFDNGDVIFGVSNSKALRLFNVMLQQKKIEKNALMKHTNFSNDLEFAQSLERTGGFSTEEVAEMFTLQIDAIVVDALSWPKGEWHFSPLARLRKDVRYTTNANRVLLDHARCLPSEAIAERFRSVKESFTVDRDNSEIKNLQPHEAYVISRFQDDPLTVEQLREMSSLPEAALLQTLYVLWLSGVLIRREWSAAFTPTKIAQIHG
ncbi:MAG: DUF4388 domain-containing protein, partial [Pyrinomonadaceae bacterium]